jgi:hypothetical protein
VIVTSSDEAAGAGLAGADGPYLPFVPKEDLPNASLCTLLGH